jgi:hypothetical protein
MRHTEAVLGRHCARSLVREGVDEPVRARVAFTALRNREARGPSPHEGREGYCASTDPGSRSLCGTPRCIRRPAPVERSVAGQHMDTTCGVRDGCVLGNDLEALAVGIRETLQERMPRRCAKHFMHFRYQAAWPLFKFCSSLYLSLYLQNAYAHPAHIALGPTCACSRCTQPVGLGPCDLPQHMYCPSHGN